MEMEEPYSEKEFRLSQVWYFLSRNVSLILAVTMASLVAGAVYWFIGKRVYKVEVSLIPSQEESFGGISALKRFLPGEIPQEITGPQAVMAILRSRKIAEDVVNTFKLDSIYGVLNTDEAVNRFSKKMEVGVDYETGVVTFTLKGDDPERLYRISTYLVRHMEDFNEELKLSIEKPFVRVLDPPYVPQLPYWPRKKIVFGISLILGFFIGLLLATWRETGTKRILREGQVKALLGKEPLGFFPKKADAETIKEKVKESLIRFTGKLDRVDELLFIGFSQDDRFEEIVRSFQIELEKIGLWSPITSMKEAKSVEKSMKIASIPSLLKTPMIPPLGKNSLVILVVRIGDTPLRAFKDAVSVLREKGVSSIETVVYEG